MATKRINNGIHTIELASGDFAVATAAVDSTGAAVVPGAVTVADGADVAQGAKADVAWVSGSGSEIAILKAIAGLLPGTGATNLGKAEDAPAVSADTGVFVLGVRNDTNATPASTDGDYSQLSVTSRGAMFSAAMALNTSADGLAAASGARAITLSSTGSTGQVETRHALLNGAGSYDMARGNVDTAALITAAAVTSGQTGADQTNVNGRGVVAVLDMTIVGTGSVTLNIQGKDAASGKYYTIVSSPAIIANSTVSLSTYAGASAVANVLSGTPLPRVWRVTTTANNANATTYTVGASVIV